MLEYTSEKVTSTAWWSWDLACSKQQPPPDPPFLVVQGMQESINALEQLIPHSIPYSFMHWSFEFTKYITNELI